MIGWHHRLNEHEFEQALGDREGQGSLACCSPWGHKEPDITERLNNNNMFVMGIVSASHRSTQIYYHFREWPAFIIPLLEEL